MVGHRHPHDPDLAEGFRHFRRLQPLIQTAFDGTRRALAKYGDVQLGPGNRVNYILNCSLPGAAFVEIEVRLLQDWSRRESRRSRGLRVPSNGCYLNVSNNSYPFGERFLLLGEVGETTLRAAIGEMLDSMSAKLAAAEEQRSRERQQRDAGYWVLHHQQ